MIMLRYRREEKKKHHTNTWNRQYCPILWWFVPAPLAPVGDQTAGPNQLFAHAARVIYALLWDLRYPIQKMEKCGGMQSEDIRVTEASSIQHPSRHTLLTFTVV